MYLDEIKFIDLSFGKVIWCCDSFGFEEECDYRCGGYSKLSVRVPVLFLFFVEVTACPLFSEGSSPSDAPSLPVCVWQVKTL